MNDSAFVLQELAEDACELRVAVVTETYPAGSEWCAHDLGVGQCEMRRKVFAGTRTGELDVRTTSKRRCAT